MKYDFDKMTETEKWLVCSVVSNEQFNNILEGQQRNNAGSFTFEIIFSMNGKSVPFSQLAKRLDEEINRQVEKEIERRSVIKKSFVDSKELLQAKMRDVIDIIDNITE